MKRVVLPVLLLLALCAPPESQSQDDRFGLRLIAVQSQAEAAALRERIQTGASFEALARTHSRDASAGDGGYLGLFAMPDLNADFRRALDGVAPGQTSAVIPSGADFVLLQRLSSDETTWIVSMDAGLRAFREDRFEEAAASFQRALQHAEKLAPVDYRLEDSLHGLAEAYRLLKRDSEAEPFYRRYLALHWGGPSAPEVLDRFSALVALAYFRDARFEEELRNFEAALDRAALNEEIHQAMGAILFKVLLTEEAETLMLRAARLFPASRDVHYFLAEIYRVGEKTQKALDTFEQLTRMKAPADIDPDVDRIQQSVVYQKIGSIRAQSADFEEATSAYRKALELTPDSEESRLGLGDIYIRQGRPEDALVEYERVVAAAPQSVAAHFRIADAELRLGRWKEAAAAAERVLVLDSGHARARYVQATALLRLGRREEGERALDLYRKLETEARSKTNRTRDIVVLNRGAAAKFLEGQGEESIEMFLDVIESFPDAPTHYINLGTAQSKLGRHKAAVETFRKMLSLGVDDSFLVYRNLAHEYRQLGDMEAAIRHEVVYLQNLDVALREALSLTLE